jgi:hypothetical protein
VDCIHLSFIIFKALDHNTNEDPEKESRKEPGKEKPSSSGITPFHSLFRMEVKVDIKPCQGE